MANRHSGGDPAKMELANRLFFRLYQCANMLHKTGTRAVEAEGLTTQQWAVLGALSRERARDGMSIGELARYLMVSRQNLSGLIGRMERDGHVAVVPDARDRRSRVVTMTGSGRHVWRVLARPKIRAYYEAVLEDFSVNDVAHALHYLLKILGNMERIDAGRAGAEEGAGEDAGEGAGEQAGKRAGTRAGTRAGKGAGRDAATGRAAAPARRTRAISRPTRALR
jgi:DNA-binding MarR family transcriptional regulator